MVNGKKWIVENFTGEALKFEGDAEVNNRMQFNFFNLQNCTIEIIGKCQLVSLADCKDVKIRVDNVILGIDLSGCKATDLRNRGPTPLASVTIQKCIQSHIWLNNQSKETKITTIASFSSIVHFPKVDATDEMLDDLNNWESGGIPEVYETKLEGRKLNTEGVIEED